MVETDQRLRRVLRRNAPGVLAPDAGCLKCHSTTAMNDYESSGERSNDLQTTVCANGIVNVRNEQSGSGEIHSVFVGADGDVLRCSCPGHRFNGHCYHADAIEERPLLVASAQAANATYTPVATDGGEPADTGGGRERARFGPLDSEDEIADVDYCSKYHVPAADCIASDGEGGCPHEVLTDGGEQDGNDDRFAIPEGPDGHDPDLDAETCQAINSREWCNGPGNIDDPERDTCILCECYRKHGVPDARTGDETDGRDEPTRSEQPDMGGGESTGVVDLE